MSLGSQGQSKNEQEPVRGKSFLRHHHDDLRRAFEAYGEVTSSSVIADGKRPVARVWFRRMSTGAEQAVEALNGSQLQGRTITVNGPGRAPKRAGRGTARRWKPPLVKPATEDARPVPTV